MGPKKQDFWPNINILKGNHSILRIRGVPVRQKLGMILENKVVQKLTLKVQFWHFFMNHNSSTDFFKKKSFEFVDYWTKILRFRTHHF